MKTVEAYDPDSDSWTREASLQIGRRGPGAALGQDGRIYAIGGFGAERGGPRMPNVVVTVEAYDPAAGRWEKAAPIRARPVFNEIAATSGQDGRIYALARAGAHYMPNAFEAYDVAADTWAQLQPPTAQYSAGAARIATGADGRIYAMGGRSPETQTPIAEAYDPDCDGWDQVTPPEPERSRFHLATFEDGYIYALGGLPVALVDAYDPELDRWTSKGTMPTPKHAAAAVTRGRHIFVVGGVIERDVVDTVECYTPS
jgi:N-acetylneuraminic acid mutarotase